MEMWSLLNIKTNQLIRFNVVYTNDSEFGNKYYFTDSEFFPCWFINSEESAKKALKKFVHPFDSCVHETPSTDYIKIEEYEIIKFKTK